jgi:hypothetical protein
MKEGGRKYGASNWKQTEVRNQKLEIEKLVAARPVATSGSHMARPPSHPKEDPCSLALLKTGRLDTNESVSLSQQKLLIPLILLS